MAQYILVAIVVQKNLYILKGKKNFTQLFISILKKTAIHRYVPFPLFQCIDRKNLLIFLINKK